MAYFGGEKQRKSMPNDGETLETNKKAKSSEKRLFQHVYSTVGRRNKV